MLRRPLLQSFYISYFELEFLVKITKVITKTKYR